MCCDAWMLIHVLLLRLYNAITPPVYNHPKLLYMSSNRCPCIYAIITHLLVCSELICRTIFNLHMLYVAMHVQFNLWVVCTVAIHMYTSD